MNPYQDLPDAAYWRTAVAERPPADAVGLWQPRFAIGPTDPVSSYGSCFAQHISRALRERGFRWLEAEAAPEGCPETLAREFNYGVFSSRTGNIYTPSLFNQWLGWATGEAQMPDEVWQKDGRFHDPFRPVVEPGGFASQEELLASRRCTLEAFRRSIAEASFVVFTLGLTERWVHQRGGYEYPMCPGTAAGVFHAGEHAFSPLSFDDLRVHLLSAIARIAHLAPAAKVVLSVSPVPLTATASGRHVLLASVRSKALLRAVADEMLSLSQVDYFPSYELIGGTAFGGHLFEPNRRSVNAEGVRRAMEMFMEGVAPGAASAGLLPAAAPHEPATEAALRRARRVARRAAKGDGAPASRADTLCEESLLDAFGPKAAA